MPLFSKPDDVRATKTLFLKAADLIEKNGLLHDSYCSVEFLRADETCRFCMVGALVFIGCGPSHIGQVLFDEEKVCKPLGSPAEVIEFSDNHTTSEAVAELRRVALTLED